MTFTSATSRVALAPASDVSPGDDQLAERDLCWRYWLGRAQEGALSTGCWMLNIRKAHAALKSKGWKPAS